MKSILLIGAGRFGRHVAVKLREMNLQVLAVDKREDRIEEIVPYVTSAQIGDGMNREFLESLGISNFDVCFVAIGHDFQGSLETTAYLKELGAKQIIARAASDKQEKFLLRNGADEVIHRERDVALRAAQKFSARNVFDFFDLTDNYSIFEIEVPESWAGKSIRQVNVRFKYSINIMAIKQDGKVTPVTSADHVFSARQHLIVGGDPKSCSRILDIR